MSRTTTAGLLALLASLSLPLATPAPAPAAATGPAAITAMLTNLFKAIDANDRAAAHACLADSGYAGQFPLLVYDVDGEDKPVAILGNEEVTQYLDKFFDAMKQRGVVTETRITQCLPACHSLELAYATLEFTQVATTGDKRETRDYRATVLVKWGKDQSQGPKIFHWHGSLAKVPAAPALTK